MRYPYIFSTSSAVQGVVVPQPTQLGFPGRIRLEMGHKCQKLTSAPLVPILGSPREPDDKTTTPAECKRKK